MKQICTSTVTYATSGARGLQAAHPLSLSLVQTPLNSLPVHLKDGEKNTRAKKDWSKSVSRQTPQSVHGRLTWCHTTGTLDGDHGARKRMISSLDLPEDRFAY